MLRSCFELIEAILSYWRSHFSSLEQENVMQSLFTKFKNIILKWYEVHIQLCLKFEIL